MILSEFLLARITEDEEWARFAKRGNPPITSARVLAECEAKRQVTLLHHLCYADATDETWARNGRCDECNGHFPCRTLRALALPYADHPDYRPEWKP